MDVARVAEAVRRGEVVAVPTDTVYGLACMPDAPQAIAEVFALKGRPPAKALPVLGAGPEQLAAIASLSPAALRFATRFWPGPLTIVCPRAPGFAADLGGTDRETVAVRVPEHQLTLRLLEITGPLAVTSANPSGLAPASAPAQVSAYFPALSVLDGGPCRLGTSSTVVSVVDAMPVVLRVGAIPEEDLLAILGAS